MLLVFVLALPVCGCKKLAGLKKRGQAEPVAEQPADPGKTAPAETVPAEAQPATPEGAAAANAIDQTSQVIVLLYHRFEKPKNARDLMAIEPGVFEQQMQTIKDKGVTPISMPDFLAWKRGEKNIPPKSALITIDDGYKTGYDVAWPILKKHGFPFVMFIYTDFVRGEPRAGGQSLSWDQLAEMRDAGVAIESHTVSHADLRHLPKGAKMPGYEAWLENEIAGSKKKIEDRLGIKVSALAFPYGKHNPNVVEASKQAGYEALFTTYGQKITFSTPLDGVGRYSIEPNTPQVFESAVNFTGSASGSGVAAAPSSSVTLTSTDPAAGATVTTPTPLIKADLSAFGAIDPATVEMRIPGIGQVPAKFDPATKTLSYQLTQKLHDKDCTVIVSAKAQGKRLESRWSFQFAGVGKNAAPASKSSTLEPKLPTKNP